MVHGDYLYRGDHLANVIMAVQEGAIGSEWDRALTHKPVTFESSPQEIREYLLGGAMPECSVCHEKVDSVEARQLSVEEVQQIKQHIRQRNQKAA